LPQPLDPQPTGHDFSICKLCGEPDAIPTYTVATNRVYVCPDCDFHYLDRLDPAANDAPVCLTEQQERYIEDRLADNAQVLTARLQLIHQFVDLPGRHALDIGTGVGQFLTMLADDGALGEGVEPSGLRRAFAQKRFGLHLHRALIEEPFCRDRKNSFDLITLWDVLEHVNDPVATMQSAFALLKPGGWLFIETDNRDVGSYRLSCLTYRFTRGRAPLFLPHFYRPVPYGHKQIFRPAQLYSLVRRCGFELVAATPRRQEMADVKSLRHRPRGQIVLVARKPASASIED
jgi:2-polyprenyl-6-hydroxyphenyl methylase/3-demethylubiquinone-9 3-methyltransferase